MQESEQSVKVMQEHRGMIDLLEKKISQFEDTSQEVAQEIKTFGDDIRKHFSEEEEIVFPLVLKAVSAQSI
jgi:hemerythrin-like domain-containing protein